MRPQRDPARASRLRPGRRPDPSRIADSKVGQFLTLLNASGVVAELDALLAGRPGPRGIPPRTALVALMLAAHHTGRAAVADAWWILHFRLSPTARTWLGLPTHPPADAHARIASSRRLYRAVDRITTALDPARCDRRRRLPRHEADAVAAVWDAPEHAAAVERLRALFNRLVLTPVRLARRRGHLRGWHGTLGIDATSIPVMSRPAGMRSGLGSVEVTAGWHFSGGSDDGVFGYSAHLIVAAHRGRRTSVPYPQLCLGFTLDSPSRRVGANAVARLEDLAQLDPPTDLIAVDRAYTGQHDTEFQIPARRMGHLLALDYKVAERGRQGSHRGSPLVDGVLACPCMPEPLQTVTTGLDDDQVRVRGEELDAAVAARDPYWLHRKQGPDERGSIRYQCPAAGPSPSVNCSRRDRLHPPKGTPGPRPTTPIDLTDTRSRRAHPAARPTVPITDAERLDPPPPDHLPTICRQTTMTVHADEALPKYRQDLPYLGVSWLAAYKAARSHTEGLNGRLKGQHFNIGDALRRPMRGRVGHHLAVAVILMIANLAILDTWVEQNTGEPLPDTDDTHRSPVEADHATTLDLGRTTRPPPAALE
ncbi:hypothetical protein [Embleya sp. NPDC005575]|uniref:hypothetical protein n=1 Tax=Embleya sp. NPDC005575 TaxID=3156892 RepID=UPI0033B74936